MRKILTTISTIVVLFLFLYSCSDIPRVPLTIPPDPTGTTKPNISGYSTHIISGVVDMGGFLVPIILPDFNKVRFSVVQREYREKKDRHRCSHRCNREYGEFDKWSQKQRHRFCKRVKVKWDGR